MLQKSDNISGLAKALVTFQGEVENIKKDANNPFFKSKYASLANILDGIREPLSKHGLSFCQFPSGDGELTTILMHSSGEYLCDTFKMSPVKNDPQALGSAITYARRYTLAAVLGLNVQEDDDGNAASGKENKVADKFGYGYSINK